MKQTVRILILNIMAMVYFLIVGLAIFIASDSSFAIRQNDVLDKQGVISEFVPEFYHHINRSENHVVAGERYDTTYQLKLFSSYIHVIRHFELQSAFRLLQRKQLLVNVCIRYRKADGIFPYHYFW